MNFNNDAKVKYVHLANLLRSRRNKQKLTQFELAKELKAKHPKKVHVQFVSNWERGICEPPRHCVNALMGILKIDKSTLIKAMEKDAIEKVRRQIRATVLRGERV